MKPPLRQAGRTSITLVRIGRLYRGENIHARLKGFDVNMGNLGGITFGRGQSPHMGDIHLSTEIALGSVRVPFNGRTYEWSMSGVTIAVDLENGVVVDYYSDVLQEGSVETVEQDAEKASLDTGVQGDASAEAGFGWKNIPIVKLLVRAHGSAKRDAKHVQTSEASAKVTPIVVSVERTGDKILRAGGALTDRLRPQTKDLRGVIVSPYRKAKPSSARGKGDLEDEVPTPLVKIEAIDPTKPVIGWVSVRAEREDFVLDAAKTHEEQATLLHETLKEDKADWLKRRGAAETELRKGVAALAALKTHGRYRNKAGAEEIDLYCCSFCFQPEWDEASNPAEPKP